ncbi:(R)-mandelonitrile lyase-like [Selaginella moellendorffii]|nr:(R)-mandelonitrile lyase-like [Selaginella moellendorffii]|eukprot:XP_002964256.2 (R)-mandelonitrile lyase-like [Selaginella moellendorffii]
MESAAAISLALSFYLLFLSSTLAESTSPTRPRNGAHPSGTNHKYSFLKDASRSPPAKQYDYIIVGGGAAGCALAATLSAKHSVLLLERGGVPYGVSTIERVDGFHVNLLDYDNYTSVAQGYRSEDGVLSHRGRVLGGGTALNAGFYTRASRAEVAMFGWEPELVEQGYRWVEAKVAFKPVVPEWQAALKAAMIQSGVVPDNGFTYEHLVGSKVGGTIFDPQGKRHTAADLLEYATPANTRVLIHATVHKVLFDPASVKSGKPRAVGVSYTDKLGGSHTATLAPRGEVIVSSGAVGSPQLLQLSGIGPKSELSALGIPLVLDHPQVGQAMADNPNNVFFSAGSTEQPYSLVNVAGITEFGSYIEELSAGQNTTGLIQCFVQMLKDPAKLVNPAYLELVRSPPDFVLPYLPQLTYVVQKVSGPFSKGFLRLKTTDVRDNPIVRYNYYQHPRDLAVCVQAVKVISKTVRAPAFHKFSYQKASQVPQNLAFVLQAASGFIPPADTSNDTALAQYCVDSVVTIWHAHGGCLVGGVVDKEHRVIGTEALRVIDISTFNSTPGANPQATVMMLGRYMGLRMMQQRKQEELEAAGREH